MSKQGCPRIHSGEDVTKKLIHLLVSQGHIIESRRLIDSMSDDEAGAWKELLALPTTKTKPASGRNNLADNIRWLQNHSSEFPNKWVALFDGELVDSDESRIQLQERLKVNPSIKSILITRIETTAKTDQYIIKVYTGEIYGKTR